MTPPDIDFAKALLPGKELHDYLRTQREAGAVVETTFAKRPAWLIVGNDELSAAFRDNAAFPAGEQYQRTIEPIQGRTFQSMDGREHHVYRKLATPAFRSRAVEAFDCEGLQPLAHEMIDRFAGNGEADLVKEFTGIFPFLVIARLLGVPRDAEYGLMRWSVGMLQLNKRSARDFTEYMLPALEERRRAPREDVLSALLHSEVEGRRLTDEEVLSHIRLLFSAGAMTTHEAIGNMMYALLTHADALDAVRADDSLLDNTVEELLRWETPVAVLPRMTLTGTQLGGVEIPAGATALFAITAANRDPAAFADPDRFDIHRPPDIKLSFGHGGEHSCPGIHLARRSLRVATAALIERLPELQLLDETAARPSGCTVRGPKSIPVRFRPASLA